MAKPRTRRVPVALSTTQTATAAWLRGLRFSGFSLVMLLLLVVGVVVLAPTLRVYIAQQQQISDQQQTVAHMKAQVADMTAQRARWNDPSYIRSQARDRLYYVMPGEVSYLVIDDRAPAARKADQGPVSTQIQATRTDWLGSVFGSFMTAGLSSATPTQLSGGR